MSAVGLCDVQGNGEWFKKIFDSVCELKQGWVRALLYLQKRYLASACQKALFLITAIFLHDRSHAEASPRSSY